MQIASVSGEKRAVGGRHANERVRRRGLVPAVIYGHGEPPETVSISRHDLELALAHARHVIALQIDGRETRYLIKEVQYDHLQKTPIHVDLMRVDASERVRVKVALELRGVPQGVRNGGVLLQTMGDLDVECPLLEIPESIRVDIAHLGLNQSLHVRELELPPGMKVLHEPETAVAVVRAKREEVPVAAPAEAEAAAEPEVIGRVAREQPEEEGGQEK
jgi:large subunit ribosomal protein L25